MQFVKAPGIYMLSSPDLGWLSAYQGALIGQSTSSFNSERHVSASSLAWVLYLIMGQHCSAPCKQLVNKHMSSSIPDRYSSRIKRQGHKHRVQHPADQNADPAWDLLQEAKRAKSHSTNTISPFPTCKRIPLTT
ncbi:hypothetical protein M752DRAFT_11723 [Aspergillus phoenicis ATCC 13157]|uniref:Uncharacterized protein n=1 Tax=Aspergillus phoenicis ATCC 13157 TaxID=1353007 RepID=A0A370Q1Y1_ASPPH|nr:hypothetical protein M752DRAFT_11723 [Aspergillus phoenicis ATCC 13157]